MLLLDVPSDTVYTLRPYIAWCCLAPSGEHCFLSKCSFYVEDRFRTQKMLRLYCLSQRPHYQLGVHEKTLHSNGISRPYCESTHYTQLYILGACCSFTSNIEVTYISNFSRILFFRFHYCHSRSKRPSRLARYWLVYYHECQVSYSGQLIWWR